MKRKTLLLLLEAYRRWITFGDRTFDKSIGDKWLGLGTESEYRSVIKDGYMVWHDGITPKPRIGGWLKLTIKGEEVIRQIARAGISEYDFLGWDLRQTGWDKLHRNSVK